MAEATYYPHVERFLKAKTAFGCFRTEKKRGLAVAGVNGEIDVVGLRHVGGDLAGDIEVVAVEVKDNEPFLKSAGQTLGYGVMADRCYLASVERFTRNQRDVAAHLGIGLISISPGTRVRCVEVQSAPKRDAVRLMRLELIERMGFGQCSLCRSFFQISGKKGVLMQSRFVQREGAENAHLQRAFENEVGYAFWVQHVGGQRRDTRSRKRRSGSIHDRRYLCPSCVTLWGVEDP